MAPATTATLEAPPRAAISPAENRASDSAAPPKPSRRTLDSLLRNATDDEILGLVPARKIIPRNADAQAFDADGAPDSASASAQSYDRHSAPAPGEENREANAPETSATPPGVANLPAEARAALDANPELRRAWQDARAYRENFATPEDARNATVLVADLTRMDALFYSRRPEDHAELARSIASLDPAAFASLAQAIASVAADSPSSRAPQRADAATHARSLAPGTISNASPVAASVGAGPDWTGQRAAPTVENSAHAVVASHANANAAAALPSPSPAQTEFFHATNAAAVEGVLEAIESQVERLLPEGVSKSARSRVVGEIYRELDTTLRSNRQLGQQMREAFRSGALDADHQHAIVSLVTGRARQALPAVAKRVLNEWTSTIVAANQDRRARQRTAERRVDIAGSSGSGNDARRGTSPRDINYSRMSDADILNL
jgi:hypothetical protein